MMQSSKALDFAHSCACNWYSLLLVHKSHSWQAWRDSQGSLNQNLALLAPLLRGDMQHGISLLNWPLTGRDELTFLLTMTIPIWRQGWSDLSEQRHKGHPFPRLAPFIWEQGENHLILVGAGDSIYSWSLVLCPAWLPLGQAQRNARLVTGRSWQSSVLQTLCFSCQLLRVVPGGSCYFYIETHFLLIISVLHLENQI